jgi:hypothetical protein
MNPDDTLKRLSPPGIPRALEKAERYRLLNQPVEAESICLDILAVDPRHQRALVVLILALTDQFRQPERRTTDREARAYLDRLSDPYQRAYYAGIIAEREGRALLRRSSDLGSAYACFREAMEWYEKAETLRAPDNEDALLRWNSCLRAIQRERLAPPAERTELPLE